MDTWPQIERCMRGQWRGLPKVLRQRILQHPYAWAQCFGRELDKEETPVWSIEADDGFRLCLVSLKEDVPRLSAKDCANASIAERVAGSILMNSMTWRDKCHE